MAKSLEEENDIEKPKNFEDILEKLGGFGKFQAFALVVILYFEIPAAFLAFSPVFIARPGDKWLCNNETMLSHKEICNCTGSIKSSTPTDSIVTEWGLICDKSWIADSITTLQMSGMFFGNIIPPQLSDWYGRKPIFVFLIFLMLASQTLTAVAQNIFIFAAARFFAGVSIAGYFSLNGIYSMEFLTPKWRQLGGCLGPLGEGVIILGLLAWRIKEWRQLIWATTVPIIAFIFLLPFIPESPRWLIKCKRYEEAEIVSKYIANTNGVEYKLLSVDLLKEVAEKEQQGSEKDIRFSYLDLLRKKSLRFRTLIFFQLWFCWSFTYFGTSFNIRNIKGIDMYLIFVMMGISDAIGFRIALLVNNRIGRKKALILFCAISAVFFIIIAFFQLFVSNLENNTIRIMLIAFLLSGKLCVAGARSAIRILTAESYPTAIRTMGFGVSRISATLGGMAAPQIAYFGTKYKSLPMFCFAIVSVIGSTLCIFLNETNGKPLEEEIKSVVGKVGHSEERYQLKSARPDTTRNRNRALSI